MPNTKSRPAVPPTPTTRQTGLSRRQLQASPRPPGVGLRWWHHRHLIVVLLLAVASVIVWRLAVSA